MSLTATKPQCDACTRHVEEIPGNQPHATLKFCGSCLEDFYGPCSYCKTPAALRGRLFGKTQDQCWQRACAICAMDLGLKFKIDTNFMTGKEALALLSKHLKNEHLEEEGLGGMAYLDEQKLMMEKPLNSDGFNWISCYAVTGGNEGHYVHIDLIHRKDKRKIIASLKTFNGMAKAYQVARRCAELLGA